LVTPRNQGTPVTPMFCGSNPPFLKDKSWRIRLFLFLFNVRGWLNHVKSLSWHWTQLFELANSCFLEKHAQCFIIFPCMYTYIYTYISF
jgi:hypothetical protein